MRRILVTIVAAIVLAGLTVGPVTAARAPVKVAVIVGPVGSLTDYYRSIGSAAAREARRWTSDVVAVFSPDATWPRVKAALRGASIVVYLGHGNGWPSPYRDALYPPTQNGLGLNPVAGGDDSAHQYFGESFLSRQVRLATGAVVLLHHLCYASGNSEPGVPEGTLAVGQQRVDNYAAGWIRAGADAVVADTYGDPAGYIRSILGRSTPVEQVWRSAPTAHGHIQSFASDRSPGFRALMDPTNANSGFYRSLVVRPGLGTGQVRAGAAGIIDPGRSSGDPGVASLAAVGVTFRAPALAPATTVPQGFVVGTKATLSLPMKTPRGVKVPTGVELGVRWDPITLDPNGSVASPGSGATPTSSPAASAAVPTSSAALPTSSAASPSPTPTADPLASVSPGAGVIAGPSVAPPGDPSASPDLGTGPAPTSVPTPTQVPSASAAPPIDLVAPEVVSSVVSTIPATVRNGRLIVTVELPLSPGSYRLVTTVHTGGGVAYDAATQALVPALAVRVSRPLSAAYSVVPTLTVAPGGRVRLPVRIANDGSEAWADQPILGEDLVDPSVATVYPPARLVGRWLPLGIGAAVAPDTATVSAPARVVPGSQTAVELALIAPTVPGDYLLLLDIDSPLHGSLAAAGVSPAQVRVTVSGDVAPAAQPVPAPSTLPAP